jgi:hypothetical protein
MIAIGPYELLVLVFVLAVLVVVAVLLGRGLSRRDR